MCSHSLIQTNEYLTVWHSLTGCWQTFFSVLWIEILSLDSVVSVLYYLEMFLSLLLCSLTSPLFRYTQNGILHMLDRNKRIKSKPERFQNCKDKFDLVITCEERVYDQVLEGEASHKKCLNHWRDVVGKSEPLERTLFWYFFVIKFLPHDADQVFAPNTSNCVAHSFFLFLLLPPRSEFKRAGDSTACARHQCRHSG